MPMQFDRLLQMLDRADVGVWQLHVPSGQINRNDVFLRLTQARAEDLDAGLFAWAERIHPADRDEVLLKRKQLLTGELGSYSVDYRVRRTGKGWVALRARVAVMERDAAGKPLWVGGLLTDVSRERELERLLHAVFDRPFQFIGLLTPEGVVLETNRTSLYESGSSLDEVVGKLFWETPFFARSPGIQTQLQQGLQQAAHGEPVRFEISVTDKAGTDQTIDFTLTPLRDDDGDIVNIIPEGRNITDLARTRETLRATEQRLSTATQAANIGLWEWDVGSGHTWFSEQWYRLLGFQRGAEPTNNQGWTELTHPDDRVKVRSEMEKHLRGEIPEFHVETRMRRGDGTWGWFLTKAGVVERTGAGRVRRVAGILMDTSDRHEIEQRLILATEGGNIGLWDVQLPDGPAWYNAQWWSMLGYGTNELPATLGTFYELLHPDDHPLMASALNEVGPEQGSGFDIEFRMRCKNGSWTWIHSKGQVIERASNGHALRLMGVNVNVTNRKAAERRLAAAERLESIGQLAAGMAHEINTPVQYASDSLLFIRDGVNELLAHIGKLQHALPNSAAPDADLLYMQEELPSALDQAVEGLARIAEIVSSMKDFSHPDQSDMASVDLNRAIQSTLVVARNEFKYVAYLETHFAELPPVTCFGSQINQVVLNLVVNAAHAIADQVKGTSDRGLISVKTFTDAEEVVICVSDTGGGIPEAVRDRIFEPFFTTKEVGRGTGQGLSIANNIVKQGHGGSLSFQTELGKGTTFFVRLPIEGKKNLDAAEAA